MTYAEAKVISEKFFESNPECDKMPECEEIFAAWIENFHLDASVKEGDWEECRECFAGEFRNAGDFAEHLCEEFNTLEEIPENLRFYFDFDAYGRDLLMGDYWQSEGYYFRNL